MDTSGEVTTGTPDKIYGNDISLIDATYKTTKYELPLFSISVRTTVGYSPVAQFITQNETV